MYFRILSTLTRGANEQGEACDFPRGHTIMQATASQLKLDATTCVKTCKWVSEPPASDNRSRLTKSNYQGLRIYWHYEDKNIAVTKNRA